MGRFTLAILTGFFLSPPIFSQVNLGGTVVLNDRFRVFIFIGHSNMDGRAELLDTVTNPRLWMWDLTRSNPVPDYPADGLAGAPRNTTWRLSRDIAVGNSLGRPATPFLKKMLAAYPDYYFGVIQLSEWESIIPQAYLPGLCWYVRIMHYVNQILPNVTIQGVVTMLGWDDGCTDDNTNAFDVNFTSMAHQMRIDLSMPKLPFVVSQQEVGHGCNNSIQPTLIDKTNNIPNLLTTSAIVQSSGPYVDDHHYNTAGLNKWADSAVVLIQRMGWGPPPISGVVASKRNDAGFYKNQSGACPVLYGFKGNAVKHGCGVAIAIRDSQTGKTLYSIRGEKIYTIK
jgi:hypothetical protein